MEKTFDELVEEIHYNITNTFRKDDIIDLLKQVREATGDEFLKALEGVDLPMVTTMKIMAIIATTDRIKLTDENRKGD